MRLAVSKGPRRIGMSLPSPTEENRSIFRNGVFSISLNYRTMDRVHKPNDSVYLEKFTGIIMSSSMLNLARCSRKVAGSRCDEVNEFFQFT
jgi:hypothetical protein